MRKVFIGLFLIALIAGVSWLKSERDQVKHEQIKSEAKKESVAEVEQLRQNIDSIMTDMQNSEAEFVDSIDRMTQAYSEETDSLHTVLAESSTAIDSLTKLASAKTSQKKTAITNTVAKKKKSSSEDLHRKIIAYSKKRHSDLPNDLSSYEQRIALSEIREETAKRFKISVDKLNKIRSTHNLKF